MGANDAMGEELYDWKKKNMKKDLSGRIRCETSLIVAFKQEWKKGSRSIGARLCRPLRKRNGWIGAE